jgi:hypothetical protein
MSLAFVLAVALGVQAPAWRDNLTALTFTRVRSTEPYLIGLIFEGYERSPTFRDLVDFLQQTNVIVSIQPLPCAGGRVRSCLVGVRGSSQERHIWIKVDPRQTIRDRLVATIAHELQHAVEIAEHPDVTDASSVLRLYRTIAVGRCGRGLSEECETTRARVAERHVLAELWERRAIRSNRSATGLAAPYGQSTDISVRQQINLSKQRSLMYADVRCYARADPLPASSIDPPISPAL